VAWVRTFAFTLVGLTAGFAGIVYESRLGSISVGFDGGTYVLYAVAAAVIGGASLMGGRGKAIHPLIGGLVLAVVANGLDLLNITTAGQDMATALVLLIAVTIDSVVRRRGVVGG
jgi:D-xylose transport system permease protein